MGKIVADTGQPDDAKSPAMSIRPLWGMRRRIQKFADSKGYSLSTAMIVLMDSALKREGIR